VPVREDLATPESWAKPISTRGAIEEMPAGCIAVADAMGVTSAGISSMAPRVEIGFAQLSGVARSSRTGTKRSVNAGPTRRPPPGTSGCGPFIQQRRMPFFNSMVVMVAVVIARNVS